MIVSDKPPAQLKLSQRLIARMEWGLVAHIEVPDLETRVAILKHKASFKGLTLSDDVCFFIAERIFSNIRQLEGAINRLAAYYKITNVSITKEICQSLLNEISSYVSTNKISVENILKSVALVFEIKVSDLKGESRLKNIALARQVAMYLAKEHISDSLQKIAQSFGGKTHSTLLHGWKKISSILETDENLSRQIQMIKRNLSS